MASRPTVPTGSAPNCSSKPRSASEPPAPGEVPQRSVPRCPSSDALPVAPSLLAGEGFQQSNDTGVLVPAVNVGVQDIEEEIVEPGGGPDQHDQQNQGSPAGRQAKEGPGCQDDHQQKEQ